MSRLDVFDKLSLLVGRKQARELVVGPACYFDGVSGSLDWVLAPLAQGGLDEAHASAIGLGRVRPGTYMPKAEFQTGVLESQGAVAAALSVMPHRTLTFPSERGWRLPRQRGAAITLYLSGQNLAKATRQGYGTRHEWMHYQTYDLGMFAQISVMQRPTRSSWLSFWTLRGRSSPGTPCIARPLAVSRQDVSPS